MHGGRRGGAGGAASGSPPRRPRQSGGHRAWNRPAIAADAASFINGTAGTWHDLDEGNLAPDARRHPAPAGSTGRSRDARPFRRQPPGGGDPAYEASARIWRATKARLSVHPHGTYGPVAAAIALAKLRGDNASAIASAINIAAALGLAASRMTSTTGQRCAISTQVTARRAGFEALALRDAGFTGEADAVASIMGNIYGSEFDAGVATAELGETWWIRRSYFKRFATGRYAHGALDLTESSPIGSKRDFRPRQSSGSTWRHSSGRLPSPAKRSGRPLGCGSRCRWPLPQDRSRPRAAHR